MRVAQKPEEEKRSVGGGRDLDTRHMAAVRLRAPCRQHGQPVDGAVGAPQHSHHPGRRHGRVGGGSVPAPNHRFWSKFLVERNTVENIFKPNLLQSLLGRRRREVPGDRPALQVPAGALQQYRALQGGSAGRSAGSRMAA
jgi:hypothetical protein